MDLTYEETMQRIKEYEDVERKKGTNYKFCKEVRFPYRLDVYKGENKIIIVPLITSVAWYSTNMAWYKQITDTNNSELIGNMVLEALEHIRHSCVDARTPKERDADSFIKKATSCKSYKTFNKKYLLCCIILNEDGTLIVSKTDRLEGNEGYGGTNEDLIFLNLSSSSDEIGNAVKKSFEMMEQLSENTLPPSKKISTAIIETLSNIKISYEVPDKKRYKDKQDFSVAEIYQGYSYLPKDCIESVADMFFGTASELDCSIDKATILNSFVKEFGVAISVDYQELSNDFYDYFIDITGKCVRKIMYIKKIDESELFSCEVIIRIENLKSATISKTIRDFEKMAKSCKRI